MGLIFPLLLTVSFGPGFVRPTTNLTFLFITSFGQFGFNSSGAVPAATMALEDINSNADILPGYNLVFDKLRDSECHRGLSSDVFFEGIQSDPVKLAVVGCGCSVATDPVAEISHRWNISQISYASGLVALSDRTRFRRYFRNSPTFAIVAPALRSTMEYFNWRKIALLTQNEGLFIGAERLIRQELEPANITVQSQMFNSDDDPLKTPDLFFIEEDCRIFLVNCYSILARRIICEAQKRGLTSPRYVWIFYDWYPKEWWITEESTDCTDDEIKEFLEMAISLRRYPLVLDTIATTDAGISAEEFEEEYVRRAREGSYQLIDAGVRLYDVMWVLATALNQTMMAVENGNISGSGCEEVPGSLVPLEEFQYSNEKMGCLIQWNLQQTDFSGVSERVLFDNNGTRVHHVVRLRQYRFNGTKLKRQNLVVLDERRNNTFTFDEGINITYIFPDGIPPDGSPVEIPHTFHVALVVVFDVLATLGIIFAVICFFFNLLFRNKKVVKLSSPKLNYLIIAGAILMYTSVYIYLLPSTLQIVTHIRCIVQYWLFTVGYSLIFGTIVAKMWRVYHIFHNPAPNKRAVTDGHLVLTTLGITGISVFLLFLWTAIPHLRGMAVKERDDENPLGQTEYYEVREDYVVWVCYEASSPTYFWQIFIYAYLVVLQIVGIVLAFQTRKVKLQGLRDSKFIASIVYISSIILVMLALVTFGLRTYINIGTGIFVTGILVLTTITLCLLFIPKMVLLYQKSDDETIKSSGFVTDMGVTIKTENNLELEQKVLTLQSTIRDKDAELTELRKEVAALKESSSPKK